MLAQLLGLTFEPAPAARPHRARRPVESRQRLVKFDGVPFVIVQGPFTEAYGLLVWGRDDGDDVVQRDALVAFLNRARPGWHAEADD